MLMFDEVILAKSLFILCFQGLLLVGGAWLLKPVVVIWISYLRDPPPREKPKPVPLKPLEEPPATYRTPPRLPRAPKSSKLRLLWAWRRGVLKRIEVRKVFRIYMAAYAVERGLTMTEARRELHRQHLGRQFTWIGT